MADDMVPAICGADGVTDGCSSGPALCSVVPGAMDVSGSGFSGTELAGGAVLPVVCIADGSGHATDGAAGGALDEPLE